MYYYYYYYLLVDIHGQLFSQPADVITALKTDPMKRTKFDIDCVTELLKKNLEFENMPKPRLQQIAKVLY